MKDDSKKKFVDIGTKDLYKIPKKVSALINTGHKPWCVNCKTKENLTYDHIIPTSKGGSDDLCNGQILCLDCNFKKGDKLITNK